MQVAVSRMADVHTDGELKEALRTMMRGGDGSTRGLRTFIAELEGPDPVSRYPEIVWESTPTGIKGVTVIKSRYVKVDMTGRSVFIDRRDVEECELYLDRRGGGRFCLVHADLTDDAARRAIDLLARTTNLTRSWVLPNSLAEYAARSGGNGAAPGPNGGASGSARIRREDASDGGHAEAEVAYYGMVSHRGGTSIDAHIRIARDMLAVHERTLEQVEKYRVGPVDGPDFQYIAIDPLVCILSQKLDDIAGFADAVFDSKRPLLMSGSKIKVADNNYQILAVDHETATAIDVMIGPQSLSVHTQVDASGSAALRLMAHVQHRHDAGLYCIQVTAGVPADT